MPRFISRLARACIVAVACLAPVEYALADGRIDASTVVSTSHGTFQGIQYKRYEAMFAGVSS